VLVLTVVHPVIVFAGGVYLQVVVELYGETDAYVPPLTVTPESAEHRSQLVCVPADAVYVPDVH
jgi:hypothetical protein